MNLKLSLALFCLALAIDASSARRNRGSKWKLQQDKESTAEKERKGKLFSLFSVVTFRNSPCASTESLNTQGGSLRNGTCFTTTECSDKNGQAEGNCASGFGVCCIFLVDGVDGNTDVNENCTYIQNPGFPTALAAPEDISYKVNRLNNEICQLRLDFEAFQIAGPADTSTDEGVCVDTFNVNGVSTNRVPEICGLNTGQHMYVDAGEQVSLDFSVGTNGALWDVKVTQLECSNTNRAPDGCLQYHTTLTGRLKTFNFDATNENHLNNQQYSICIRPQPGFCCVQYQVCADEPEGFSLDPSIVEAKQDDACLGTHDYIVISNSAAMCNQGSNLATDSRYCGGALSTNPVNDPGVNIPICDCTAPFAVDVVTNGFADGQSASGGSNSLASKGVCLDYSQVLCS